MCNPVALVMAGISIVSDIQSNKQASEAAETQASAANQNSNLKQAALNQQATELQSQASQKANAQQIEAAQRASAARVSAGEAGVSGTGVNRVVGNIGQQAASNLSILNSNLSGQVNQINANKDATYRNQVTQLENIQAQKDANTKSPFEMGVGAVGSYFGGLNMANSLGISNLADVGSNLSAASSIASTGSGMLPSAASKVASAASTGFSDDFLSGNFLQNQLNNLY